VGGLLCPFRGGAGSPPNTMWLEPRPTSIPSGILIQPFGHNKRRPKNGGLCLFGGEAGSSSNTMLPGLRPICIPSGTLIHPTVSPQYTNVTDRQTGQDRTDRQQSDSIGRTALQTVTQKYFVILVFSERELVFTFAICYRPSVCRLSVCNARAPYSGGSNFRQYFYGIWYLGHPLTSTKILRRS